ncbi:MAG: rhomboid family intramembrane serine protease [Luteolibacter sp.]|uniref:rhomboid family intramembrane serine protease n=1 Tax=Luteolibacter sp. TaxID=1962973 RepID=UPI00326469BB
MGIADRDYQRNDRREPSGFFAQLTPVVKWLLILNIGIYFIESDSKPFRHFGAFTIQSAVFEGRIWQFVTFQFLHGSAGHVFFNCLALFFFGPWMERWWGGKKFLIFYLLCGAAGGVFYSLLMLAGALPGDSPYTPLVGASAGIYGILIGVALTAPELRVRLLIPPVELSMRQLAMWLMGIAVGTILLGYFHIDLFGLVSNEGGQAGHLGGAILGFFLVRYPWILGSNREVEIIRPKVVAPKPLSKLRPRSDLEKDQDTAVDKILDKISREGFQSLTQEERDFLQKASNSK